MYIYTKTNDVVYESERQVKIFKNALNQSKLDDENLRDFITDDNITCIVLFFLRKGHQKRQNAFWLHNKRNQKEGSNSKMNLLCFISKSQQALWPFCFSILKLG